MPSTTPLTSCRVFGCEGSPKRQRIHRRNRSRAHREDVAQDAADAGRGPLIGLDIAGVVVAFHLEDHGLTVADIDDAGILAGAADHLRAGRGQGAQPFLRGFVGTMLVPHRREDAKFGKRRLAPDDLQHARVFVGLQPVRCNQLFGDLRLVHIVPRMVLGHVLEQMRWGKRYRTGQAAGFWCSTCATTKEPAVNEHRGALTLEWRGVGRNITNVKARSDEGDANGR